MAKNSPRAPSNGQLAAEREVALLLGGWRQRRWLPVRLRVLLQVALLAQGLAAYQPVASGLLTQGRELVAAAALLWALIDLWRQALWYARS